MAWRLSSSVVPASTDVYSTATAPPPPWPSPLQQVRAPLASMLPVPAIAPVVTHTEPPAPPWLTCCPSARMTPSICTRSATIRTTPPPAAL